MLSTQAVENDQELVRIIEASRILSRSPKKIREMVIKGELKAIRGQKNEAWQFERGWLYDWIEKNSGTGPRPRRR